MSDTKYFYNKDSINYGPFTKEELKDHNITSETKVWHHPLPQWVFAKEIEELNDLLPSIDVKKPLHSEIIGSKNDQIEKTADDVKKEDTEASKRNECNNANSSIDQNTSIHTDNDSKVPPIPTRGSLEQSTPPPIPKQHIPVPPPIPEVYRREALARQQQKQQKNIANSNPNSKDSKPKTYVTESIIASILCCIPIGIISLIFAYKTSKAIKENQIKLAKSYSQVTFILLSASILIGAIIVIGTLFTYAFEIGVLFNKLM